MKSFQKQLSKLNSTSTLTEKVAIGEAILGELRWTEKRNGHKILKGRDLKERHLSQMRTMCSMLSLYSEKNIGTSSYERARAVIRVSENAELSENERELGRRWRQQMDLTGIILPSYKKIQHLLTGKHTKPPGITRRLAGEERAAEIRRLAKEGNLVGQIASELDFHENTIRKIAKSDGIEIPKNAGRGTQNVDVSKAFQTAINHIEGYVEILDELMDQCANPESLRPLLEETVELLNNLIKKGERSE